jgi:hypothetical protein
MLDVIEDEGMLYSMPGVQPPEEREALNACAPRAAAFLRTT